MNHTYFSIHCLLERNINALSRYQQVQLSIALAKDVLPIFEQKYPNDNQPRKAIKAAEKWLVNPSKENIKGAMEAGSKTWANASEGAVAYAAHTAGAAAYATDYSPWAASAADYSSRSKFWNIIPNGQEFIKTLGRGK